MLICTVVGARPQFIKAAALSRVLRKRHKELLIHTGQHYDYNMSEMFFEELSIPNPDYNLGIAGGSHGRMTGRMLIAIEDVLIREKPDMLLLYGDTNSTLAGALAAAKMKIPVCHIEAGQRAGTIKNPEEINRVLTDRISTLMMCCTDSAVEALKKEGMTAGVYKTGDLMLDAIIFYTKQPFKLSQNSIIDFGNNPVLLPKEYYLMTCHREENTTSGSALYEIMSAMNSLSSPTVYPVHPRNRNRVMSLCTDNNFENIILVQPVSYRTSLHLIKNCLKVVTDSGGLQREAWFLNKQCVTILDFCLWPETMGGNMNQLSSASTEEILLKLNKHPDFTNKGDFFGDGQAADIITEIITQFGKG